MAISKAVGLPSQTSSVGSQNTEVLSGWKDIAQYVNKGVRTVQRYEREMSLPIRRLAAKSRASVSASRTELDGWLLGSPARVHSMPDLNSTAQRTNKLKANFLQIDSQVALTFSGIALTASDQEKSERTTLIARKAYNAIIRLRNGVYLSDLEKNDLNVNLARLKSELRTLGQTF